MKAIQRQYQVIENSDELTTVTQTSKIDYYQGLERRVKKEKFDNETYALIMKRKCSGAKISEIERELEIQGERLNRETIRHIIRRYEHKWNIRSWTWKEMGLKADINSPLILPLFYHFSTEI